MFTHVVKRVCRGVDAVVDALVDAEVELVVHVLGEALPLQDELHDAGAHRGREEAGLLGVETGEERRGGGKKESIS